MTTTLVRSITEAMRHIKRGEDVRAEGVGGSLYIHRLAGRWWCEYGKQMLQGTISDVTECDSTADVHDWLREFFPRLQGRDPRGDTSRYSGGRMSREDQRRLSAPPTRTRCRRK